MLKNTSQLLFIAYLLFKFIKCLKIIIFLQQVNYIGVSILILGAEGYVYECVYWFYKPVHLLRHTSNAPKHFDFWKHHTLSTLYFEDLMTVLPKARESDSYKVGTNDFGYTYGE